MDYYKLLHLKKEPFSNSPDPTFFYRSRQHIDCLQKIELALRLKRGLNVVIGNVGTGKTTLCRQLIQSFAGDNRIESHLILDPDFEAPQAFLGAIVHMFMGHEPDNNTPISKMKEDLKQYLFKKGLEENKTIVLIIDEGQKMTTTGLEILRELLNFETNEFKLLQIIIFAQTEFDSVLSKHANVADRINLYLRLSPLNFKDTCALIKFRISQAVEENAANIRFFSLPALWQIYRSSGGYPRKIIHLCHQCLLTMIIQNRTKASRRLVRACAARTVANKPRLKPAFLLGSFLLLGLMTSLWGVPGIIEKMGDRHLYKTILPLPTSLAEVAVDTATDTPPKLTAPEEKPVQPENTVSVPAAPMERDSVKTALGSPPIETPPETSITSHAAQCPTFLGEVPVVRGETLTSMIQQVYGIYKYAYYRSVLSENSQITDPNHLVVGDRIRFPTIPTRSGRVPSETWWVALAEAPTLTTAVTALRDADNGKLPLRLLTYWNQQEGLKILITYKNYFTDSVSAEIQENQLMPFPGGEKKVICLKKKGTLFFGSPFIEKPDVLHALP